MSIPVYIPDTLPVSTNYKHLKLHRNMDFIISFIPDNLPVYAPVLPELIVSPARGAGGIAPPARSGAQMTSGRPSG
jgi:hypothetical protein